jgi:hypothetical protein
MMAQGNAPVWLDADIRNLQYPQESYYAGFAEIAIAEDETQEKALDRAKQVATGELSDRIRVSINTSKTSIDVSVGGSNMEEQIRSTISSIIKTTSQTEVAGSKVETYYDSKTHTAYAFAHVSKAELSAYYQKQISFWLNKVEGVLQTAGELMAKGYKMKARSQCESVIEAFAKVVYAQDLLTAIEENVNDTLLQQSRSEQLRNTLIQTITDLENSIYIYLTCNETVNGQATVYIADRLPGIMTEQGCGCNFTELPNEADYMVIVDARLTRCNEAPDKVIFCYANATVSIYNAHTQKTLTPKIDEAKGGWTNRNYAKAIDEAFNELSTIIAQKVIPVINN